MMRFNHSDCCKLVAALAIHKKAELVAADKEFAAVEKKIKINWLK